MNNLIISSTLLLLLSYALVLYRRRLYVATFFWILAYSVSFLLPVLLITEETKVLDYSLTSESYLKLNYLYLLMSIIFIMSNSIFNRIKILEIKHRYLELNYKNLQKANKFFLLVSLVIIGIVGVEAFFTGSYQMLGTVSLLIDSILAVVTFGINITAQIRLFYAKNKKEFIMSAFHVVYALFFGLLFSFARRLVIFPLIISFCFIYIMKRKKPKLLNVFFVMVLMIFVALPLMISIRTNGLVLGLSNYFVVLSDLEQFRDYLAMSTDVSWSYTIAAVIMEKNVHISPITLLKPIAMLIPRSIWPDKPLPLSLEIVGKTGVSDDPELSIPVSIVGEAFVYFGTIGVIIFGMFWGVVTSYFDKKISRKTNSLNKDNSFIVLVFISIAVQTIMGAMRGDFATTLQETIMVMLTFCVILYIFCFKNRSE